MTQAASSRDRQRFGIGEWYGRLFHRRPLLAARIMALAWPGEVLLTASTPPVTSI